MIHCQDCKIEEGEGSRGDFDECPHGSEDCEIGSACLNCCAMADIGVRY